MREAPRRASGPTVLIWEYLTGGGLVADPLPPTLAREGAAIRRALVADFAAVPGVQVVEPIDARCLDADPRPANVTLIVADPEHPIDLCRLAGSVDWVLLIAPETNACLADLDRCVARGGGRSLGSAGPGLILGTDKAKLAAHLAEVGVPTPPTVPLGSADAWPLVESPSGRVVIKPTDGAGSVDTFICSDRGELPRAWRGRSGGIVQPYRPGPALSASFLVGRDGRAHLLAVGRQEIEVGAEGEVVYRGGTVPVPCGPSDLAPVRQAVESIPGLFGFVGVDFIRSEPTGGVEVIEINPRVTTSIVGLVRLARPGTIARAWLDLALGIGDPGSDLRAIGTRPSIRFGADGTIFGARLWP